MPVLSCKQPAQTASIPSEFELSLFSPSILPQTGADEVLSSSCWSRHSSKQMIVRFPADIIADSTIQASVKSNADGSETWEVEGGNVNLSLIPPICLQQYICNDCNKVRKPRSPIAPYQPHLNEHASYCPNDRRYCHLLSHRNGVWILRVVGTARTSL